MPDSAGNLLPGEPGYAEPTQNGGLINTAPVAAAAPAPAAAPQATASSVTPEAFTVAPNQTVASNVESIIAKDSPLLQQAESRAMQRMNARGLLNSSIAISAGQSALYDAALPIAQADAATFDRAASNTVQAKNTAGLQNAQLATGISQANASTATQKLIADNNNALQEKLKKLDADTTLSVTEKQTASQQLIAQNNNATSIKVAEMNAASSLANIDAEGVIRTNIAQITASYNTLVQTNASAASLYQQMLSNIADIARDPNVADKQGAMANQLRVLNDGLGLIGEVQGLNLGANLTFDGPAGAPAAAGPAYTTAGASGGGSLLNGNSAWGPGNPLYDAAQAGGGA